MSHRHCEERSDEAIQFPLRGEMDCFAEPIIGCAFAEATKQSNLLVKPWIASLALAMTE
jgi:hypothetical protein